MARNFDATDDVVTCALGACGFAFGPGSMAMILRCGATTPAQNFLGVGDTSGSNFYGLSASGADVFRAEIGSSQATAPTIQTTASAWQMLGASKANGSVAVRFHKYLYSSNAHSHEDDNVNTNNSGTPTTNVFLGSDGVTTVDAMEGELLIVGVWDVVLSDAQYEALPFSLSAWFAVMPKGLWLLDQAATSIKVADLTGGGANETALTGTTIGTNATPVFGYGAPIIVRTRNVGGAGQSFDLTPATETDSAAALRVLQLTAATETDTAQALDVDKAATLGVAAETDSAQALSFTKTITLGIASETDTAQALDIDKAVSLGVASETDTAEALTISGAGYTITTANETDSAVALTFTKTIRITLGIAAETDSATALSAAHALSLTQAAETSTALGLDLDKYLTLAIAASTDAAQALSFTKTIRMSLTFGTETDTAVQLEGSFGAPLTGHFDSPTPNAASYDRPTPEAGHFDSPTPSLVRA